MAEHTQCPHSVDESGQGCGQYSKDSISVRQTIKTKAVIISPVSREKEWL